MGGFNKQIGAFGNIPSNMEGILPNAHISLLNRPIIPFLLEYQLLHLKLK